jgi:mycothiol synthase
VASADPAAYHRAVTCAPEPVTISEMTPDALSDVARLCARELVLDRDAAAIPGILMRRPCISLLAVRGRSTVGSCIGSVATDSDGTTEGFIDLLVVDGGERRRGIGRQLADEMERQLAARGCERICLAGHGPYYAWPGVDIHYTAAVCFAEDLGYRRQACEVNMEVDLRSADLDAAVAQDALRDAGIEIRRASPADDGPLQESLASTWQRSWITEIAAALRSRQAGLYLAAQDGRYVGFCAYGLNRMHEIGPVGTSPNRRGLGIGGVLLKRCLADQRDQGVAIAELVWAGPLSYFSRTLNATIGRAFWQYEKDLTAAGQTPDWRDRVGLI